MFYARKGSITFAVMQFLAANSPANIDEIVAGIRDFSVCRRSRIAEILVRLRSEGTITAKNDEFILSDEAINYVEDVLEIVRSIEPINIVPAFKVNVFTPEMKNYNTKLYLNKRNFILKVQNDII